MSVELATAYISIVPETSKIAPGINKAMGGVEQDAGKRGRSMGGKLMGGLGLAAKAGAVAAGAAVAAGFGTAMVKGFNRLKAIEAAEAKLTGLGHSAESVEKIMSNASAAVKGTAFGLGDAASAAASAVASGVKPGKDLERTLKLVGDAAAIAGADYGDMAAIFNKVSAGGIIQGEELAQLGDRGIPILQLLADELGVSALEVKKLASEGKVDFETFQNAMEAGMGGAALESGKTFQGAMNNVGAAMGRLGANLLSGVFPKIAPALQGVIGWLDSLMPVAEKAGKVVGDVLSWIGTAASALFDVFVKGDFNKKFREAFGVEEDHPIVGVLFNIRDTALMVWGEITGGFEAFAAAWKYNDGEVTSSGFPGLMERIGYYARQAFDYIRNVVIPAVQDFVAEFQAGEGAGGKFRDVLTAIWDAAKSAFGYVRDTALPALFDLVGWLVRNKDIVIAVGAAVLGYKGYMMALHLWTKAVTVATTVWTGVQKALNLVMKLNPIGLLIAAITALVAVVVIAYRENETFRKIVDRVWAGIKTAIDAVVKWFKDTAWPWMRDALGRMREAFSNSKEKITGAWDSIKSGISDGWEKIKDVFGKFKEGLTSLKERFKSIKSGIAGIWSNLTSAIAGPIRKVVQFVNDKFLGPLENALNKIPGVSVSLPRIPVPEVPSTGGSGAGRAMAMLAAGGTVPGWSPHDRADNIPAMLTAGEYVLPVKATRSLMSRFGPGFLEQLRRGLPGFASGGAVSHGNKRVGGFLSRGWEWLVDVIKDAGGWVKNKFTDLLSGIGDSWPAQVAKGAFGGVAGKLGDWIKNNIFGGGSAPGGGQVNYGGPYGWAPKGMNWQTIWSLIKMVAPESIMTSNYRPGAITASGVPSLHGQGRAVDIVSSNMAATFMKLRNLLKWSQLFYSPMGSAQIGYRDAIVHRTHFDHIHAALADGGLVAPVFDRGGTLAPGLNVIDNRTGGPEPLRRADLPVKWEREDLDYLADRIVAGQVQAALRGAEKAHQLELMGAR